MLEDGASQIGSNRRSISLLLWAWFALVRNRPFAGGIGFAEWDDAHQQVSQYLSSKENGVLQPQWVVVVGGNVHSDLRL